MFNKAIPILAVVLLVGSAGAWYWWARIASTPEPLEQVGGAQVPTDPELPMPVTTVAGAPTLPTLADSDTPFDAALLALPGAQALGSLLRPQNMIRHLVATVDNLPRHKLAVELRPLEATGGSLLVSGGDLQANLDERNGARYTPAVQILANLDMHALNDLYRHYYPLFQRAYEDLGYPQKSFNERLVAVIDHLLETPHPPLPLALARPKVFWEFADPDLEGRSAGQKLMLRVGPENRGKVERKLRELRALLATSAAAPTRTKP
ncbi:MAG TPA: DUF3014 domain-containing protein [Steroidobacteraceae bacterium]|nr:DUF3014 domain-containing protein [Steroidobacteraceae bacterium]